MKTAIFICGPTAVGKTSIAIKLAQWLNTEIISFDSRQFFKELKIGAAPPSEDELALAKHHLIGQLNLNQKYDAGRFEADALAIIDEVFTRKEQVILVGGSGLYMKALTEGFDEMPPLKPRIRETLNDELAREGLPKLQAELKQSDPKYYEQVDLNNPQRVIRALEVIRSTGQPYSGFRKGTKVERPFNILKIGLEMPRQELYAQINLRVEKMLDAGLEEEVRQLRNFHQVNAMQTVGYREWIPYFENEKDQSQVIEEIKKNSRRYAKRQLTWFRRDEEIEWFKPNELDKMKNWLDQRLFKTDSQ